MDVAEGAPQAVRVAGRGDDVDVIGHEAIGPHFDAGAGRGLGEEVEVQGIVAVLKEVAFAAVAALGDAGEDESGEAGHGRGYGGVRG